MKLLIVDDEELTRTGVISSLDWSSLGIDEVIQADDGVHGLETARPSQADFCQDFLDFLAPFRTKCIYLEKKMQYLVYFLFSQEAPSSHQIHAAGEYLCSHFEKYGRYTIAVGDTVYGLPKAYQTYTSAVILLQSGYFFPENSLLTSESLENIPDVQTNVFADTPASSFADILSRQDADGAKKFLDMLHQNFFKNHRFLQNPVKDMYYKLFLCLEDARHQQKIAGSGNVESIAETIDDCFTFP